MVTTALITVLVLSGAAQPSPAVDPENTGRQAVDARERVLVFQDASVQSGSNDALYAAFVTLGLAGVDRTDRVGVDLSAEQVPSFTDRPTSPDDARDGLLAARAAFGEFDLVGAKRHLSNAEQVLLGLRAPHNHHDLFADVLLLRAEIELALSEGALANVDLRRVARLLPDRQALHPGLYAPALVEAYALARQHNTHAPPATVIIWPRASQAERVEVLIDGVALPPSSGRTFTVAAGPHLLTVRAEGRVTRSRFAQLDPGAPLVWEPLLFVPDVVQMRREAVSRLQRSVPGSQEEQRAARSLLERCGASWLVLSSGSAASAARVFTASTGMLDVQLSSSAAIDQASAVQAGVRAARDLQSAQAGASSSIPTSTSANTDQSAPVSRVSTPVDETESFSLWPVVGTGAVAAVALAAVTSMMGGAAAAYFLWFNRDVAAPPDPDRGVTVTCCIGAP